VREPWCELLLLREDATLPSDIWLKFRSERGGLESRCLSLWWLEDRERWECREEATERVSSRALRSFWFDL
jgi:hypothetical protein